MGEGGFSLAFSRGLVYPLPILGITFMAVPLAGRTPPRRRRNFRAYLFLMPTFVFLIIFAYFPPLSAGYHAFFNWDGNTPPTFVGFDNFTRMAQDQTLIGSLPHLLFLVVALLITSLTVPLLVASLIFNLRSARLGYLYRVLFLVPVVIPLIVTMLLWQFLLDPTFGLVDTLLRPVIGNQAIDWLGDQRFALFTLAFIGFPWVSGVNVLIFLAGLQNIPTSVMDAALLDGAVGWRRLRHIDLPLVMGQVKVLSILAVISGVQGYGLQFVLTRGGPGTATMVPGYYMYFVSFSGSEFGYGSAIGLMLFLIILAFTYLNLRYIRSSVEYAA
jgi:ABC-type sugar transport system permease subunit